MPPVTAGNKAARIPSFGKTDRPSWQRRNRKAFAKTTVPTSKGSTFREMNWMWFPARPESELNLMMRNCVIVFHHVGPPFVPGFYHSSGFEKTKKKLHKGIPRLRGQKPLNVVQMYVVRCCHLLGNTSTNHLGFGNESLWKRSSMQSTPTHTH